MITNNLKYYNNEDIIALIEAISEGSLPYNLNNLKDILSEATTRQLGQEYVDMLGELIKFKIKNPEATPPPEYRQINRKKYPKKEEKPVKNDNNYERSESTEKVGKFAQKYHDDTVEVPLDEVIKEQKSVATEEKSVKNVVKPDNNVNNNKPLEVEVKPEINETKVFKEEEMKSEFKREVKKSRRERKFEEKMSVPPADVYENIYEEDYDDEDKFPILSFISGLYKVIGWILFVGYIAAGVIVSLTLFKSEIAIMIGICFAGFLMSLINIIIFYALSEKIELNLEIERHLRRLK